MRDNFYRVINVFHWVAIAATAILGTVANLNAVQITGRFSPWLPLVLWLKARTWWLVISSLLVAVCSSVLKKIGEPWLRAAVKRTLDEMQAYAFGNSGFGVSHDRVTLFQYKKWCFDRRRTGFSPRGGFLVPFCRSGHVTQKISVVFRVPDNAEKAEGIAGVAYVTGNTIQVEGLPDVSEGSKLKKADLEDYSSRTFVTTDWLRQEKSTARSLCGIPVRVKGKHWGVVVLDSRSPSIQNVQAIIESYELVAKVLGVLLERS